MSTNNDKTGAVASVIRPGQSAAGPPGWEERRIEKESQEAQAEQDRIHDRESSTGLAAMKEKVHKLGESLHLVEPKDPQQRTQAQMQVGHPPSRQIDRILGSTGSLIPSLLTLALVLHLAWLPVVSAERRTLPQCPKMLSPNTSTELDSRINAAYSHRRWDPPPCLPLLLSSHPHQPFLAFVNFTHGNRAPTKRTLPHYNSGARRCTKNPPNCPRLTALSHKLIVKPQSTVASACKRSRFRMK